MPLNKTLGTALVDILAEQNHNAGAIALKARFRIYSIISEIQNWSSHEDLQQAHHQTHNTTQGRNPPILAMCHHMIIRGACGHVTCSFVERACVPALYSHSSARNVFPGPHRVTAHTVSGLSYCQECGPEPKRKGHDHSKCKCTVTSLSASMSALSISESQK